MHDVKMEEFKLLRSQFEQMQEEYDLLRDEHAMWKSKINELEIECQELEIEIRDLLASESHMHVLDLEREIETLQDALRGFGMPVHSVKNLHRESYNSHRPEVQDRLGRRNL